MPPNLRADSAIDFAPIESVARADYAPIMLDYGRLLGKSRSNQARKTQPAPHSVSFHIPNARTPNAEAAIRFGLQLLHLFVSRQLDLDSIVDVETIVSRSDLASEMLIRGQLDPSGTVEDALTSLDAAYATAIPVAAAARPMRPQFAVSHHAQDLAPCSDMLTYGCQLALELSSNAGTGVVRARISLDPTLFFPTTAQVYADQLVCLSQTLLNRTADRAVPLAALRAAMSPEERRKICEEFNTPAASSEVRHALLHSEFEACAARWPRRTAVRFRGIDTTYAELDARCNRVARRLRALGVVSEDLVGMCLERGPNIVIATIAILKAGAAFLPLDTQAPDDRMNQMLSDAETRVVLADAANAGRFDRARRFGDLVVLDLDDPTELAALERESAEPLEIAIDPCHLSYSLFTSGSTGKPKAVLLEHRGATHAVKRLIHHLGGNFRRYLGFAAYTFDVSVADLFAPLSIGATFVAVTKADLLTDFERVIADNQIDVLGLTPRALCLLNPAARAPTLETIWLAGEPYSRAVVQEWIEAGVSMWNEAGPTEGSIVTSGRVILSDTCLNNIGLAETGVRYYILDEEMQPVPVGVLGELFIGGVQVGRGYLKRPELTSKVFLTSPFLPASSGVDARLYRTGDLARFHSNGEVELRGRIGSQIKLNGYRIELEEIDTVLRAHPGVAAAAVQLREDVPGNQAIVAYVVATKGCKRPPPADELRAHCAAKLVPYMVPAAFMYIAQIPLTASGKTDFRALPAPAVGAAAAHSISVSKMSPTADVQMRLNPTQSAILAMWESIFALAPGKIAVDDDFFEMMGDSLLAARLVGNLRKAFPNAAISFGTVYKKRTVRQLAAYVGGNEPVASAINDNVLSRSSRTAVSDYILQAALASRDNAPVPNWSPMEIDYDNRVENDVEPILAEQCAAQFSDVQDAITTASSPQKTYVDGSQPFLLSSAQIFRSSLPDSADPMKRVKLQTSGAPIDNLRLRACVRRACAQNPAFNLRWCGAFQQRATSGDRLDYAIFHVEPTDAVNVKPFVDAITGPVVQVLVVKSANDATVLVRASRIFADASAVEQLAQGVAVLYADRSFHHEEGPDTAVSHLEAVVNLRSQPIGNANDRHDEAYAAWISLCISATLPSVTAPPLPHSTQTLTLSTPADELALCTALATQIFAESSTPAALIALAIPAHASRSLERARLGPCSELLVLAIPRGAFAEDAGDAVGQALYAAASHADRPWQAEFVAERGVVPVHVVVDLAGRMETRWWGNVVSASVEVTPATLVVRGWEQVVPVLKAAFGLA
ncbi:hypothetical protein HDU86_002423 [Geranomyces michiganensis]|nr:hypothetical protein HDU86_002423 [Geranomyces michiganensis]